MARFKNIKKLTAKGMFPEIPGLFEKEDQHVESKKSQTAEVSKQS